MSHTTPSDAIVVGSIIFYDGAFIPTIEDPETQHYTVQAEVVGLTEDTIYAKPINRFLDSRSDPRPFPKDAETVEIPRDKIQDSLSDGVYETVVVKQQAGFLAS